MSNQHKKQAQRTSQKNQKAQKRSQVVRLEVAPEQLFENGNLQGAIEVLQTHLRRSPQDDQRWRLLGQCLFDTKRYSEAAIAWFSVSKKNANDCMNIGIAFLNAEEWDQARVHLERALQQQEHPRTCYLLALAHARGSYWLGRDIETIQRCIALLQQARALPACPPEAYLRLDKALWSLACKQQRTPGEEEEQVWDAASEQGFQIIEEAFLLYPDHEEVRMEFAKGLMYRRKQYEAALLVLAPLLQRADLSRFVKEEVIGLCVEAALSAHLYAQASQYLHRLSDVHTDSTSQQWAMLTILQGDLSLRQNDGAAARVCYEQAIQSDLFVPRFLGLFCCAWTYLLEEKLEQARTLVRRASAVWFEHAEPSDRSSALDSEPICIGTVHIGDDSPALCVKLVCEKLLHAEVPIEPTIKGYLCYFVYQYHAHYYEERLNVVWEYKEEHERLLLQAAELFEHPILCETLASYFEEKGDLPRAVEYHLRWCIQSFMRDAEDFDEDNVEYAYDGEKFGGQELRLHIHGVVWSLLQEHQTASLVHAIFLPFYRSFWRELLQQGKMHQEIVDTTALFLRVLSPEVVDDEQWDYAYSSKYLGHRNEAEQAYRACLERDPENTATLNNLAILLEEQGLLQEAMTLIEKALALEPEDTVYANNKNRIKKKGEDVQQTYARQTWSQLSDTQKQLLYLVSENTPSDWSYLIKQMHVEEPQLQESWEALIGCGALTHAEGQGVMVESSLLSLVRNEGFLLLLIADILRNTSPRKKRPWVPNLAEFVPDAISQLDKLQRSAFHKVAFKRLQTCQNPGILATVFLPFYRSTWKRLLQEGNMMQEIVEVTRLLTTLMPTQTKSELWDYAYHAHLCALSKEAEQVYKRYLEDGKHHPSFHNLAVLYTDAGRYDEALYTIEQALCLEPEDEGSRQQKTLIERKIEQKKQEKQQSKEQAEKQQRQYENMIRTAPERWGKLDYYKRRILGILVALNSFEGLRDFAQLIEMEEKVLKGHWARLIEQGMILEGEHGPCVNPYILELVKRERSHAVVTRIVHTTSELLAKPIFNSQQEYKIYSILLEVFPNQLVFPNMALQAIFPYERMQAVLSNEMFGYYLRASVDFCVTLTSTYLPLVAFEVDSDYHDSEKQLQRDQMKDQIFSTGGVELIRIRAFGQPSPQAIRYDIIEAIRAWARQWRTTPQKRGWAIDVDQEINFDRFGPDVQDRGGTTGSGPLTRSRQESEGGTPIDN